MAFAEELQSIVSTLAETIGPSVVGIGQRWGLGSGIVVAKGQVLTNAHNVRGEEVTVTFADGRTETGRRHAADFDRDLAVLAVDTKDVRPIDVGSPNGDVRIGRPVFALSNPGGRGLRVSFGLVSGTERSFRGPRGRRISGSIEHTAPLLPGSSGGPLVTESSRLLGVNTNRLGEGFYLAIPADETLQQAVTTLGRGEVQDRPRLGIGIAPPWLARRLRRAVGLPEADGVLIRVVEEGSPAGKAGLNQGDLIVQVAGREATEVDALQDALDSVESGGTLHLKVLRGTDERTVEISF
ncbi:MAG: S1C family serine protease [Actinomycetota bacterium]|nr:S1C family serine protease [Actinomycetota bacterium]